MEFNQDLRFQTQAEGLARFDGATPGFHVLDIFSLDSATAEEDRFLYRCDNVISRKKREEIQPKPLHVRNRESFEVLKRRDLLELPGDFRRLTATPFESHRGRKIPVNPTVFNTELTIDDSRLETVRESRGREEYKREQEYVAQRKVDVQYMQFLQRRAVDKYRDKQEAKQRKRMNKQKGERKRGEKGRSGRKITYKEMCKKANQLHWTRKEKRRLIMEFLNGTAEVIQKAYRGHVLRHAKHVLREHRDRSNLALSKLTAVTKIQTFGRRCVHKLRVKQVLQKQTQAAKTLQNLLRKAKEREIRRKRLLANMDLDAAKQLVLEDHDQWLQRLQARIEVEPENSTGNSGTAKRILGNMYEMKDRVVQVAERSILSTKSNQSTLRQNRKLSKLNAVIPRIRVDEFIGNIQKQTPTIRKSAREHPSLHRRSETPNRRIQSARIQSTRRRNIFKIDHGECEAANALMRSSIFEGLKDVQSKTSAIHNRVQMRKQLCETYDDDYRFMASQQSLPTKTNPGRTNKARKQLLKSYSRRH